MTITKIKLQDIEGAEYNPSHRSSKGYCADLIASIRVHGQLMPAIVVNNGGKYRMVDGHRRMTALKELGATTMFCVVRPDIGTSAIYAAVNGAAKRLSGHDKLTAFLKDPEAVDHATAKELRKWPLDVVITVAANGGSVRTLKQARTVAEYCATDTTKAAEWLAKHSMTYMARRAMEDGVPPDLFREAITNDRPFVSRWAIA